MGLVMKDIHTNTTHLYKFANHSYKVGNDLSLLHVPERSQDECEMYRCCVWPPVGHRILQSDYSLPQGNGPYITASSFTLLELYLHDSFLFVCLFICFYFSAFICLQVARAMMLE